MNERKKEILRGGFMFLAHSAHKESERARQRARDRKGGRQRQRRILEYRRLREREAERRGSVVEQFSSITACREIQEQ